MITKEDDSGEVVGETENYYKLSDGTYKCKYCGEIITKNELPAHLNKCSEAPDEVKGRRGRRKRANEHDDEPLFGIEFEDEVVEAMANELYNQLIVTPGCKNSKDKIQWVIRWFANNKIAQNNPQKLYEVLSKTFKTAEDEAISFIVDSVFDVKSRYQPERRGYRGRFVNPPEPSFSPFEFNQPPNDPSTFALQLMYQMWRDIQEHRGQNQTINPEEIKRMVEAEVERRVLKEQVENLQNMVNNLMQNQPRRISEGGWQDDYARLIADLGSQILQLGEKIIIENKKFRASIIRHLAPRLRGEDEYYEGGGGETDEEIYKELEEAGYVE